MPKKLTSSEVVSRFAQVWGDRWDYSSIEYESYSSPVSIICREHGPFRQRPSAHVKGLIGCTLCQRKSVNADSFISKATEKWEGRWDYSKTIYQGKLKPITVTCPEHGDFTQIARDHLDRGRVGCPQCRGAIMTTEEFILQSKDVWGPDKYNYDLVNYSTKDSPVVLQCNAHEFEFSQSPRSHLEGREGCGKCSGRYVDLSTYLGSISPNQLPGLDYTHTTYTGWDKSIQVSCPIHGPFTQSAYTHRQGFNGCRRCSLSGTSALEGEVAVFLESLGLRMNRWERGLLGDSQLEVDFYFPDLKVAIEFNGLYFHSERFRDKNYHARKFQAAQEQGITLIQIWEDWWRDRPLATQEKIKQVLGVSTLPKVGARKTKIVIPPEAVVREFLNRYHIQGSAGMSVCYGLEYRGELVAVAAFKRRSMNTYELVRYATSMNVVGGFSKLIAHFDKNVDYLDLITFADLCLSTGHLYLTTGWVEDKHIPADYSYVKGSQRYHKFNYRLSRMEKIPDFKFEKGKSERQLAYMNGLLRVYDAGKIRFTRQNPYKPILDET